MLQAPEGSASVKGVRSIYTRHFAVINLWILDDPAIVTAQIKEGELLLVAWQRDAEDCSDGC